MNFNPTEVERNYFDHTQTKEEIKEHIEYMKSKFNWEYEQGKLKSPKYEIEYEGIHDHKIRRNDDYETYPHRYYKLYSKKLGKYYLRQIESTGAEISDIGFEKHHGKLKTYIQFLYRTFPNDWQSGNE